MNIDELLRTPVAMPAWQGEWARVWLRPDIFSAQEYIVAALAFDKQGLIEYRVLSSGERFGCIYGSDAKAVFEALLSELRMRLASARAMRKGVSQASIPEMFRIEPVGRLQTQMPGEALDRMMTDGTLPMEQEEGSKKKPRFATRDAEDVVREVLDGVRLRAGIAAENFIREDFFGDKGHEVGVNLVTDHTAGIVASGWYSGIERIQLEFLLSASKMETYVAATKRDKKGSALFFVRPTDKSGLTKVAFREVERRLGDLEWQLERQDVRVVTHDDPNVLAGEVIAWAESVT